MKTQSISKGFMILSIASTFSKLLSLLYLPILLLIIGDEGYGIYMAAYQVFVFMYVLTNAGIPSAISKLISEHTAKKEHYLVYKSFKLCKIYLFTIGLIFSVVMLISSPWLSNALHYEKAELALLGLAPAILLTSISSTYRGYFQGLSNMTPTAVSQIIEQVTNTIFTLLFAYMLINYSVEYACAGGTIGTSVGALLSIIYLVYIYRKNKPTKPLEIPETNDSNSTKAISKKIFHYSFPITASIGMQFAGNIVDLWNTKVRLLVPLGVFDDISATVLYGHLAKYQQILNAPISVIAALCITILPAISSAAALNSEKLVLNKIKQAFRLAFIITLPSAIMLSVLSKPIFEIVKLGEGFELLLYGSVVLVLMSIVQIQTSILQGLGKLYTVTIFLILGILIKLITNYFLISIPSINIMGAIIGSVLGFLFTLTFNHLYIRKKLNIKFSIFSIIYKPLFFATIMGLIGYLSFKITFTLTNYFATNYLATLTAVIVSCFISGVFYLITLIISKILKPEDIEALPLKSKLHWLFRKLDLKKN